MAGDMSRSFHTTRRHLKDEERFDYSDESKRATSIEKLKKQIQAKRETKYQIKKERRGHGNVFPTLVENITIEVADDSEYLHYPAGPEDIRALLNMMPSGVADGLSRIKLCLGKERQKPSDEPWVKDLETDPYLGRGGFEKIPGVFSGVCLGTYYLNDPEISLYGYVFQPDMPNRRMWELYLRLHMLMTFVHEIAHHFDFTSRIAKGRWRGDDYHKAENYAEQIQYQWLCDYVIPYLQEAYPVESEEFNRWIKEHLGQPIPMKLLAGDPRSTARDGGIVISSFFDTSRAFEEFVKAVHDGKCSTESRLEFADDLHMAEEYDTAMAIIAQILEEKPKHVKAITLKAGILVHTERYHEALQIAQEALSIDPNYIGSFEVMADAHGGLKDWGEVISVTDKILEISGKDDPLGCETALYKRAIAVLELGDYEAVEETIHELQNGSRYLQRRAKRLREELDKRLGKTD